MKRIIQVMFAILFCISLISCNIVITDKAIVKEGLEGAYFQGQYDALRKDICIDTVSMEWIKSCWEDNSTPSFLYGKSKLGIHIKNQNDINKK